MKNNVHRIEDGRRRRRVAELLAFEEAFIQQGLALYETIRDRVEEQMAVSGMTQYSLAERAGLVADSYRYSWWSNIKRRAGVGLWNPTLKTLVRLAMALDVEVSELFVPFR